MKSKKGFMTISKMKNKNKSFFEKIALNFIIFLYKFLNFFLDSFRFLLFGRLKIPKNIKKIVIFRTGNIGDIICSVPAMATIRKNFPKAEIILLSSPGKKGGLGAKELLEKTEFLDGLINYYQEDIKNFKDKIGLIKRLRKEKFDLFIELPQDLARLRTLIRNIIFAKSIKAKYSFGFQVNTIRLFKQIQARYLRFSNEVERLLEILKKENLKINSISFPLAISEEDEKIVREFLDSFGNKNFIAINPNAKREINLWPLERFAEVGKRLIDNYNLKILITGGKNDKERTERLKEMIGQGAISIAGKFTILQTIELLKNSQLLISGDTGAVHMAVVTKRPVLGVYSARWFKYKWDPYGQKNIVLRKEPKCHACFLEECEHLTCLKMIGVEEVLKSVEQILLNQNLL